MVIPSCDRHQFLHRAVRSALASRYFEEVIVVDDGSQAAISLVNFSDPRLRLIRLDQNQGVSSARNIGIEAAASDYLLFLDDDDYLLPWAGLAYKNWLSSTRNQSSTVVGTVVVQKRRGLHRVGFRFPPSSLAGEIWGLDEHLCSGRRSFFAKQAAVIPKAVLKDLGGFDENLRTQGPSELFYRLSATTSIIGHCVPTYVLNRCGHQSLSGNGDLRQKSIEYVLNKHAELLSCPQRRDFYKRNQKRMLRRTSKRVGSDPFFR